MSIKGKAYIAGIYEHPARKIDNKSVAQLHAEVAKGALDNAGLTSKEVDAYYCGADAPGAVGGLSMIDYMGLKVKHSESTNTGGSSYLYHVAHAAEAIAAGKINVALITCAGLGRRGTIVKERGGHVPEIPFENPYGPVTVNLYAMAAQRHMHEYGTTSEQLAWVKVAASHHAQHNPNAFLKKVVTVEEVVNSPLIASPLHRMDCCVVTDGGGAVVVVSPEVAMSLKQPRVKLLGTGEAPKDQSGGDVELTSTGGMRSGSIAFSEAGVKPSDIKYASIYDSFTITVVMTLEDLGFCRKGEGGRFVMDGNLISGVGKLPFNTDGGGMCNNHPSNRGGITKIIEAVRQARGEAHPKVQVPNCGLVLAHGTGGSLGTRHGSATLIMERE
jgi:acetyl-CoA C-acetyltransferase